MANSTQTDIALIKERLDWHFKIGAAVIGLFAAVFSWLIASYLPNELQHQRDSIRLDLDNLTKLQINKVTTEIESAKKSGIKLEPKSVAQLGTALLDVAASAKQSGVKTVAWNATNEVLSYYSSVTPLPPVHKGPVFTINDMNQECIKVGNTHVAMVGLTFQGCTQHLEDLAKAVSEGRFLPVGVIFRDARIIYNGGPLRLDGVYFVNCTFQLKPSEKSRTFGETLLASNAVTLDLP